jgi:lipopolysaccharide/colanic/teichoic acid biosynthesis glycosyltransferase
MLYEKIARLFRRKRRSLPAELSELRSVDQLRNILHRERVRADRSGIGFAMLKFVAREDATSQETLVCLIKILKHRLRCTDEIGWLGELQVGVVLPCTPVSGARNLANDVCQRFGELAPPHCELYCYPTDPTDESSNHRRNGSALHREPGPPVRALEPFFVQPMTLAKRTMDVFGAIIVLTLSAPLMLVASAAVKLTSPGPIVFRQLRAGGGSKPFWMYKFRTMVANADALKADLRSMSEQDGPAFKLRNDPRVTRIGNFLRRTSIDELPQLWNVLKGDMSLVGPRPLPCDESAACAAWHRERLSVKPGLTCIWQVQGRSQVTFDEWMSMDLRYIRSRSFWQDAKLLFQTVLVVLRQKGAC